MASTGVTGPPQPPPRTVRQDVAPKGGYMPIDVRRSVPKSIGNNAWLLFAIGGVLYFGGLMKVARFNQKRKMWREEQFRIRGNILPYLQAEEDVRYCIKRDDFVKMEAEIMKDRPGWEPGKSVYYTREWMPPMKDKSRRH
mmetsp:Transcript_256/g.448  ORF Transcript_256/g.448 Transcript_256/m.448 type:complete len:140 (-) Transcript_256:3209-3628(-)